MTTPSFKERVREILKTHYLSAYMSEPGIETDDKAISEILKAVNEIIPELQVSGQSLLPHSRLLGWNQCRQTILKALGDSYAETK